MKVSIKTDVKAVPCPFYVWGYTLVVKAGNKQYPVYQTTLDSFIGYRTKTAATKAMRVADQAVRFQFRKDDGPRGRHGVTVNAKYLRAWWRKWSRKQAKAAGVI